MPTLREVNRARSKLLEARHGRAGQGKARALDFRKAAFAKGRSSPSISPLAVPIEESELVLLLVLLHEVKKKRREEKKASLENVSSHDLSHANSFVTVVQINKCRVIESPSMNCAFL